MKIAVIIPAFNAEKFIKEAINSVLSQKIIPNEIIIVDDGSTDGTANIVNSFSNTIKYIYQQNSGSAKARNVGLKNTTSDLVAFLDADDYWDQDHLLTMHSAFIDNPDAGLIYCEKKWVDESGSPIINHDKNINLPAGWIFNQLFEANHISSASVVVARREAIVEVGYFDESSDMRNAQDYQLWLRMSAKFEILSLPQKTVNYRRHTLNRTKDVISRQRGLVYALESGKYMLDNKLVDQRNHPSTIDAQDRLSRQYVSSVKALYYDQQYNMARSLCYKCIKNKIWSRQIFLYGLITHIPAFIINSLRTIKNKYKNFL